MTIGDLKLGHMFSKQEPDIFENIQEEIKESEWGSARSEDPPALLIDSPIDEL